MAKTYTIPQLFQLAGNTIKYQPGLANAINRALQAKNEVEYQSALQDVTSITQGYDLFGAPSKNHLGLPIFMPVEFQKSDGSSLFLESAVFGYQRSKNIVITELQGNDQNVTEFINNGTPSLSISGILSTRGFAYPIEKVEEFNSFMEAKEPLKIINKKANALGVFEVVISDYELPNSEFVNFQPYSIQCYKDEPINLRINENN